MSSDYFVHLTDTHLTSSTNLGWEALERFVQQVNAMNPQPAFVVNTGDIAFASMKIESTPDEFQPVFERYQRMMSALSAPLYNVLGNHDMTRCNLNPGAAEYGKELFEKYGGPRYQSFDWGDIHVVLLDEWMIQPDSKSDAMLLTSDMDEVQLAWLKQDLASCRKGQTVLLFLHHPLMDYSNLLEKMRTGGFLRDDLHYWEIAGCDHQNSFFQQGNWRSFTTASFCGSWWNGPCIDGAPAGYALMMRDPAGEIKQYYRGLDQPLAVASPLPGQVVANNVIVDTYDPAKGLGNEYEIDSAGWTPGWNDAEIRSGEHAQTTAVFKKPAGGKPVAIDVAAHIEFELVECGPDPLVVRWNDKEIGRFGASQVGTCCVAVPSSALCDWNTLQFDGDAIVRFPQLVLDRTSIQDPRIELWDSLRPNWFGEGKNIKWDTTCGRLKTPWRYPENSFYYPIPFDRFR